MTDAWRTKAMGPRPLGSEDPRGMPRSVTRSATAAMSFPELRGQLDTILDSCLPTSAPVALLMFPYDGNVGNHLMWIGITDYLRKRRIPVGYVAHGNNFRVQDMVRAIGTGPVLFSGGVTISRLWPRHAEVKREVAAACPRNPLLSLPSTVMFVDRADRDEAADIFGGHQNVTVLTRDPVSEGQAREAFPENVRVLTAPDLSFRLPTQPIRGAPTHDVIWLARDDVEGAFGRPPDDIYVFDWPSDLAAQMPRSYYLLRASGILSRLRSMPSFRRLQRPLDAGMAELYRIASQIILDYGNRILDRGRVLVTDRLHPHVLTALRGQPTVLLPDKFGKNRAVYDNFTHVCPNVHWADTPGRALEIARELASEPASGT